jgi:membrane protein DedA with SNARE-associated domain
MVDSALNFISEYREWVFLVAFLFAMAETLLVVSIFIPSTTILVAVGALVATGKLDFWSVFTGAALGAFIGSVISWQLGRMFGHQILETKYMKKQGDRVQKSREAINRWGAPAIIVGHLFGPLRALVFGIAGLSGMKLRKFLPLTAIGASTWAFLTPKVGELGGYLIGALFY